MMQGCVSHGSGKRVSVHWLHRFVQPVSLLTQCFNTQRFEAQLMNLRVVDDWLAMCSTTPIDILGNHFNGPKYCEKRFVRCSLHLTQLFVDSLLILVPMIGPLS